MSLKINLSSLEEEKQDQINTDLEIKIENKFGMGAPKYIYPYNIINNNIILPFAYANTLKVARPSRDSFPDCKVKFNGSLRPEQEIVRKEAIKHLSKTGSVLCSMYCGFGKCMKYNTPIIMFDGSIKPVQDLVPGELLMGDDSKPRKVLTICSGQEKMYDIVPKNECFNRFGCNESHILSLKILSNNTIFYSTNLNKWISKHFDPKINNFICCNHHTKKIATEYLNSVTKVDIIDLSVKDYLQLSKYVQDHLLLYKVSVDFPEKIIDLDPYILGAFLTPNTRENIDKIITEYISLYAKENNSSYNYNKINDDKFFYNKFLDLLKQYDVLEKNHIPKIYKCNSRNNRLKLLAGIIDSNGYLYNESYQISYYNKEIVDDICYVAQSLGFCSYIKQESYSYLFNKQRVKQIYYIIYIYGKGIEDIPIINETKKITNNFSSFSEYPLLSAFKIVPIEDTKYYGFTIDGNHRYLLGDFTVTHNTACAINLACGIKFKSLIIVNKLVLINQWKESILKFCNNAKIQTLTAKSTKQDADFYIINAQNTEKLGKHFFSDIGTCIVDESHLIMAETLSRCLQYVYPRYLIGLTATPYRPDGLDILLNLYFGQNKIIRQLYKKHTVYKVNTGFKPKVEKTMQGRVNWNSILEAQASNEDRNELIIKIIQKFNDRNFLVLVKRVDQGKYLLEKLKQTGESVTDLIGSNQNFDHDARILIGTCQKVGVGFDHSKLDTLLLATDLEEYFVQYLGRIFRTKDNEPIIFDIVDDNSILNKHFNTRQKVYKELGGTVKLFDLEEL